MTSSSDETISPEIKAQVEGLIRAARNEGQRCAVLYLQGRGGLGKTHLLNELPKFDVVRDANAYVCGVIDMTHPEMRKPLNIERNLFETVRRLVYRNNLPNADTIIEYYEAALQQYEANIASPNNERRSTIEATRRAAFVQAWNAVSSVSLLVTRFDTMELLLRSEALKDVMISRREATVGMRQVIDWFAAVLPQLKKTVFVFAGRAPTLPPKIEGAGPRDDLDHPDALHHLLSANDLAFELNQANVLAPEHFRIMQRIQEDERLDSYLARYGLPIPPHSRARIRQITDGIPLLLTLYAKSQQPGELPFEVDLEDVSSRVAFEHRLVETVLNPQKYIAANSDDPKPLWLTYCLHILSFARRGLSHHDLQTVLRKIEPDATLSEELLKRLSDLALVRRMPPLESYDPEADDKLLYLHDEIWLLIDESQLGDELGFERIILETLEEMNSERVNNVSQTQKPLGLLRAMCDHIHYAIAQDVSYGFRFYLVYMDYLFGHRVFEDALVLANVFWRLLELRVVRNGEETRIMRRRLAEDDQLSYEAVRRYDDLHYSKLLRSQSLNDRAIEEAENLYVTLVVSSKHVAAPFVEGLDIADQNDADGDGYILKFVRLGKVSSARSLSREAVKDWPRDLHLFADLLLTWVQALTLRGARPKSAVEDVARNAKLFELLELLLGDEATVERYLSTSRDGEPNMRRDDNLLRLRRNFLLGQTYQLEAQWLRQRLEYEQALNRLRHSNKVLQTYSKDTLRIREDGEEEFSTILPATYLNEYVESMIAQNLNNTAFLSAELGLLTSALRRSADVIRNYSSRVRLYNSALMLNTHIEILMLADRYATADRWLAMAEQVARASEVPRAQGLVALSKARIARWKMNQAKQPHPDVEASYDVACKLLQNEGSLLRDALDERARYLRDLAFWYGRATPPDIPNKNDSLERANKFMQQALENLAPDSAQPLLLAELKETAVTLLTAQERYDEALALIDQIEKEVMSQAMPLAGQIVSGKLALQRAFVLLSDPTRTEEERRAGLERLAVALARVYAVGANHHEQRSFEYIADYLVHPQESRGSLVTPKLLEEFVGDLNADSYLVAHDELTYQTKNLTPRRWNEAWELTVTYFNELAGFPQGNDLQPETLGNV